MGESKRRGSRSDRIKQSLFRVSQELEGGGDTSFRLMILEQFKAASGVSDTAVFCGFSFYDPKVDLLVSPSGSLALFVEGAFFLDNFFDAFSRYKMFGLQNMGLIFAAVWKDGEEYLVLPVDATGNALQTIRTPTSKTLFGR